MTKADRLFRLANEYDAAFGNGDRTAMGESLRREAYELQALEQMVSKDEKDAREAVISFAETQPTTCESMNGNVRCQLTAGHTGGHEGWTVNGWAPIRWTDWHQPSLMR